MRCVMIRSLALIALFVGVFSGQAHAGLSIVSQSIQVDRADQEVAFQLTFNHAPNFSTYDSFGRPQDSFQYEIVPNATTSIDTLPFLSINAVVRGDEIGTGHTVPIRNGIAGGSDPNPASGGWGPVRANVPFTLTNNTLSFDASFAQIGTTNGAFSYRVFTTNYGSTVSLVESVSVPLPAALPIGLALIGLIGVATVACRKSIA